MSTSHSLSQTLAELKRSIDSYGSVHTRRTGVVGWAEHWAKRGLRKLILRHLDQQREINQAVVYALAQLATARQEEPARPLANHDLTAFLGLRADPHYAAEITPNENTAPSLGPPASIQPRSHTPATPPVQPGREEPDVTGSRGITKLSHRDLEWFQSIDLGNGEITQGTKSLDALESEFGHLGLSREDLETRTVLDVGCNDGWFSLKCEELGADVTAIDGVYRDGLRYVRQHLRPKFRFFAVDVSGPSFLQLGRFDIVLYLGVLYHTIYPFDHLVELAKVSRRLLFIESAYSNLPGHEREATLTFNYDGHIVPDLSSPVFPSLAWIVESLRRVGFSKVTILHDTGPAVCGRVVVRAEQPTDRASPLIFAAEQIYY